jgi:hypothetical protein
MSVIRAVRVCTWAGCALAMVACSESNGIGSEAGSSEAGSSDAGDSPLNDSGAMATAFGVITGTCSVLDAELTDSLSVLYENQIEFDIEFNSSTHLSLLSDGSQEILEEGTAGGSSEYSEAIAFEMLARCESAELLKSETEIEYDGEGKKTDMLVSVGGIRIGVSVVRAMSFPRNSGFSVDRARELIEDKLDDILLSTAHVSAVDVWEKQILFVVADTAEHQSDVMRAYGMIAESTRADTIVIVTLTTGADDFIYSN